MTAKRSVQCQRSIQEFRGYMDWRSQLYIEKVMQTLDLLFVEWGNMEEWFQPSRGTLRFQSSELHHQTRADALRETNWRDV